MRINVKYLFIFTVFLKITFSVAGWLLQDPWILGLACPLVVMLLYIVIGLKWRSPGISDEKFADSCYYLGFIFTISSIIISLFDLPSIGEQLSAIAVRFGAAMVTTVLGVIVRVAIVGFKQNLNDAIILVEDEIIEAASRFREQLKISTERMESFNEHIDLATKTAVTRAEFALETLAKTHSEKLGTFVDELIQKNESVYLHFANEIQESGQSLTDFIESYSESVQNSFVKLDSKIDDSASVLLQKLNTLHLPEDVLVNKLKLPLENLVSHIEQVSQNTRASADSVNTAMVKVSEGLSLVGQNFVTIDKTLEQVSKLSDRHAELQNVNQGNIAAVDSMVAALNSLNNEISGIQTVLASQTNILERNSITQNSVEGLVKNISDLITFSTDFFKEKLVLQATNTDKLMELNEGFKEQLTQQVLNTENLTSQHVELKDKITQQAASAEMLISQNEEFKVKFQQQTNATEKLMSLSTELKEKVSQQEERVLKLVAETTNTVPRKKWGLFSRDQK